MQPRLAEANGKRAPHRVVIGAARGVDAICLLKYACFPSLIAGVCVNRLIKLSSARISFGSSILSVLDLSSW
jgi:hypothetical protein